MIRFYCPLCGAILLAPDRKRGRRGRCAACRQKVPIPLTSGDEPVQPPPTTAEPPSAPLPATTPVRKSFGRALFTYAFALCVAAAAIWGARILLLPGQPVSAPDEKIWPLQDLVSQYQDNRTLAMEQFAGKRVKVSTTVVAHLPGTAGFVTALAGAADRPVYCLPMPASAHDFEALKPGEKVVLAATVSRLGIALPTSAAGTALSTGELQAPAGFTLRDAQLLARTP